MPSVSDTDLPAAVPAAFAGGKHVSLTECWVRVPCGNDTTELCGQPVSPDGLGICPNHLAELRSAP